MFGRIEFNKLGKSRYFPLKGYKVGDTIVCKIDSYIDIGKLMSISSEAESNNSDMILRVANQEDMKRLKENKMLKDDYVKMAAEEVKKMNLNMKISDAAISLDGRHTTVFFTAKNRIDFRTLVQTLAHKLHCRIEMRQMSEREEAQTMGGIGMCGMEVCCSRFLCDFKHISLNMAKKQNLNVSSRSIKGICGKLLCCLKYEEKTYDAFMKTVPHVGTIITIDGKEGKIIFESPLKNRVTLRMKDGGYMELDSVTMKPVETNKNLV